VFGGLNRLLAAAVVAAAVLVVPQAALASGCNGGPSAEQVYKECLPGGGGGKPTTGAKGNPTTNSTSPAISQQTAKKLKKAGKDEKSLKKVVKAFGLRRILASSGPTATTQPTAIGSAFDLGSGPTALLVVLAGTAVLLLAAGGYRGVRNRRG
jgi:hypothetical protein